MERGAKSRKSEIANDEWQRAQCMTHGKAILDLLSFVWK
jgi:hypothetical protein